MIRNIFTVAIRSLTRHRFYAFLNLIGLSIGVACFIVSALFFDYQLQFNAGHSKSDRMFRVIRHIKDTDGEHYDRGTKPLSKTLEAEFPEVEHAVKILNRQMFVKADEERGFLTWTAVADSAVLDVFDFQVLRGDRDALRRTGTCFVTESTARKLFPDKDPIGETISIEFKWVKGDYEIAGVMQDVPKTSDTLLQFGVLTATFRTNGNWNEMVWDTWPTTWFVAPLRTYVLLRENADVEQLRVKLHDFATKYRLDDDRQEVDYELQPFNEMHLYTYRDYGIGQQNVIERCYAILGIGVVVLLLAGLNYVNLVTAQSAGRAREVGLRKVSGAHRKHLIAQFLGESTLLTAAAFLLAAIVAVLCLPFINTILDVDLTLSGTSTAAIVVLPIVLIPVVGLLAGAYPAFILSGHLPVRTLRGVATTGRNRSWLRTLLVVFQFSVSTVLIVCTLVVDDQVVYMQNKDLGFDKENVVMMPYFLRTDDRGSLYRQEESIKTEIGRIPQVMSTSCFALPPGETSSVDYRDVTSEGSADPVKLFYSGIDENYLATFDIPLVAGRKPTSEDPFQPISKTEGEVPVMINEAAVRALGMDDPIGKRLVIRYPKFTLFNKILGVVKDYHNQSLREGIAPMLYQYNGRKYVAARLAPGDPTETLATLGGVWEQFLPGKAFEFEFLDERLNETYYASDRQLRRVFGFFAILAIVVGCLGILGLVTYSAQQRTKEIGVRKVLGASVGSLLVQLSKEFMLFVGISLAVAWPVSYVLGSAWLENFAYRMDIGSDVFLLSGLVTVFLVAVTVGGRTWRAASGNPVQALRRE